MKKILLGSAKNKTSKNNDNFIDVELSSEMQELPYTEESYTVDAYEQYFTENDKSEKYRLAFTISPVCSNVLFNVVTEPVYKEGSDDCVVFLNTGYTGSYDAKNKFNKKTKEYISFIGRSTGTTHANKWSSSFMVRDTAFSLPEIADVEYHCGFSIFNNHYLRRKSSSNIGLLNKSGTTDTKNFNTLWDFQRRSDGTIVMDNPAVAIGAKGVNNALIATHVYSYDDIYSFDEAISNNLTESNGWLGFRNKSGLKMVNLSTPNSGLSIYRCLNNRKANEFIDMYPDRTLYSFMPKFNKYRGRAEKNWDYCLTYPKEKEEDHPIVFDEESRINGLECRIITTLDGVEVKNAPDTILFKSIVRHNLSEGDYVTFNFIYNDNVSKTSACRVVGTGNGNDSEHYFSINLTDIFGVLIENSGTIGTSLTAVTVDTESPAPNVEEYKSSFDLGTLKKIMFRKFEDGEECVYYLRKFYRLDEEPSSALNKLAFSQTPYSDQNVQIVYTEDVNTKDMRDYMGRPISEVYLTIVKRNKGYSDWYAGQDVWKSEIEYSHCFGEVTSGFDFTPDDNAKDYNVHRIHSIKEKGRITLPLYIPKSPTALETGITIEKTWFYGDIVEFLPSALRETTIEDVYQRVNTAQREALDNTHHNNFEIDDIALDDVDFQSSGSTGAFSGTTTSATTVYGVNYINLLPEGYYYKPHYKVQIKEFRTEVSEGSHIKLGYTLLEQEGPQCTIETDKNYYFQARQITGGTVGISGSTVYCYKLNAEGTYSLVATGECVGVSGKGYRTVTIVFDEEVDISKECILYKHNTEMPEDAYDLKDGSGRYVWREVLPYNEMTEGDELYNTQFTNGAHYFHKNINFYLKRQDPTGEYGLGYIEEISSLQINNKEKDVSFAEYKTEGTNDRC